VVRETRSADAGDYQGMIALRVKAPDKEIYVAGTLFSKRDPRVVLIDNFKVEIVPEGELLLMYNIDRPGVIGNIGNILGSSNINIARMHFGRESAGGMAISVVNVDTSPSDELIGRIKALPNIVTLKYISL